MTAQIPGGAYINQTNQAAQYQVPGNSYINEYSQVVIQPSIMGQASL